MHHYYGHLNSEERITFIKKVIVNIVPYIQNKEMIDLGSGEGSVTKILSSYAKKVYAVDNDKELLDILRENCKDLKNIIPVLTKTAKLDFQNDSLDVIFSSSSFHDLPRGYENEIKRVLKPDGIAIIMDWKKEHMSEGPPYHIRLDKTTVKRRFEDIGFYQSFEKEFESQYLLIFEKRGH